VSWGGGGLSEKPFPIETLGLATRFRWNFDKEIQDGGDIRVVRKTFLYLKLSKIEIFQKTLLRFVVGSGDPSSNDPKFERRPSGAPWPTSNDAKLFLISIFKVLESLSKFNNKKNPSERF
jgi:hypothetical protein